jgi:hypothetical protein
MRRSWGICSAADIKAEADERLRTFITTWRHTEPPLPPEAQEQRMVIDRLHTSIIHFQEEKNLFALQVNVLTAFAPLLPSLATPLLQQPQLAMIVRRWRRCSNPKKRSSKVLRKRLRGNCRSTTRTKATCSSRMLLRCHTEAQFRASTRSDHKAMPSLRIMGSCLRDQARHTGWRAWTSEWPCTGKTSWGRLRTATHH